MTLSKFTVSIYFLTFLISILIASCGPNLLFENAVPPKTPILNQIPDELIGVYRCETDSSNMYVDQTIVYKEIEVSFMTTIENLLETENCSILEGAIYLPGREECIPFENVGEDSIRVNYMLYDTLFDIKRNDILKFKEGVYYLNVNIHEDFYICYTIEAHTDGALLWETMDAGSKSEQLRNIIPDLTVMKPLNRDSVYIINPDENQFNKLLNQNFKSDCDYLTPVNLEQVF